MQVKISVRHGHLSDEHQRQIRDKSEKLLHFFGRITLIEVTADLQDPVRKEVDFEQRRTQARICGSRRPRGLLAAVELAYDKVVHQIHRYKENPGPPTRPANRQGRGSPLWKVNDSRRFG